MPQDQSVAMQHIRTMERRRDFLSKRIYQMERENRTNAHDQAEREALSWAIDFLKEWADPGEQD